MDMELERFWTRLRNAVQMSPVGQSVGRRAIAD